MLLCFSRSGKNSPIKSIALQKRNLRITSRSFGSGSSSITAPKDLGGLKRFAPKDLAKVREIS